MASILRSSKFVRYVAGFARNVVNWPKDFEGKLVNTSPCLCGAVPRNFAVQTSVLSDQSLENSLRRIDQDVRRSGRISRRDVEELIEEIQSSKYATSSQSLLVIRCCGNLVPDELPETRTKIVQEMWNTLHKLKIPMDISHYNALLRVYLENEHLFSPVDFLTELESKGIEPNRVTYQRLIARYCQEGDIDGATKILQYMREKQMSVNENVFNTLIMGHSKAGDMSSAENIIGVMAQAGLEPSADTYTMILSGYAMKGDIEKMTKLIEECEKKEIFLLDKDYLDIIYALAINGFTGHIPIILEKVRKSTGYNQDAVNIILRVINKGYEDAGLILLRSLVPKTKEDGLQTQSGYLFIRQLVKAKRPISKIIELCQQVEKEGLCNRALLVATESSLQLGDDEIVFSLFKELQERNIQIRQHFFWPIFASKANNSKDVIDVLQKMHSFSVVPNTETLREYVIPNLKGKSSEIIAQLREGNVSIGSAVSSLVASLLQKKEIKEAAAIARSVPAFYNPMFIKNSLIQAFVHTRNLTSFIDIIRVVYENADRRIISVPSDEEEVTNTIDKSEVVGTIVLELTSQPNFIEDIHAVLEKLVENGISISTPVAEKIESKLGEKMTEKVSSLLGRLTSGELVPVPYENKGSPYIQSYQMNISQLERLICNLSAKGEETHGLKRQLLTLYYRAKDLEKAELVYNELEEKKIVFTNGIYAQMLDLYAVHSNLEKALEFLKKIKQNSGENFSLDESKIIRLSYELVKAGRFEDGIKILEDTPIERHQGEKSFFLSSLVWRFLNFLAEEGKVEEVNILFETLMRRQLIEVNNILLGPLIKVHLVRNELDEALKKFEWCVNNFKATPWKSELACKLIQEENADKLQKLTDLSTTVHGEVNSLYDLVFAFVECGRIRQARKILETPGLQNRPQRINTVCERYQQEGLILPLEGLKDATKDLNHIDRSDIYYQLLLSYIKQEDTGKALGLWTQMQEEDLAPTDQFLNTLGNHLRSKNMEVPFVMSEGTNTEHESETQVSSVVSQIRQKLRMNRIDEALKIKNSTTEKLSITASSSLIEKLIQNNRLSEATTLTLEILQNGNKPVVRIFRYLLNTLSVAGDINTLNQFTSVIPTDIKKIVSFDNKVCHAYLVAGKSAEYLEKLHERIKEADEKELPNIESQFPRGGAFGILQNEDLVEKFEEIALGYAERGIVTPFNVLWIHYFIKGNEQRAEQIWNDYVKNNPIIMFQKILQTARENKDSILAKKLVEHLKSSPVTNGALGNAYSCLLDVLTAEEKHDEAINTFEQAIQNVSVDNLNRTAVLRVKEMYEKRGKSFNHNIPIRRRKEELNVD